MRIDLTGNSQVFSCSHIAAIDHKLDEININHDISILEQIKKCINETLNYD